MQTRPARAASLSPCRPEPSLFIGILHQRAKPRDSIAVIKPVSEICYLLLPKHLRIEAEISQEFVYTIAPKKTFF